MFQRPESLAFHGVAAFALVFEKFAIGANKSAGRQDHMVVFYCLDKGIKFTKKTA